MTVEEFVETIKQLTPAQAREFYDIVVAIRDPLTTGVYKEVLIKWLRENIFNGRVKIATKAKRRNMRST